MTDKGLQIRLAIWTDKYRRGRYSYAALRCCRPKNTYLLFPIGYDDLKDGAEVWRLPSGTPVAIGDQ
jgi:hypothetical protein